MAHECPDCGQACYCDGDDTWMDSGAATCGHGCDPEEDDRDGFDDEAPYAAPPAARADEGAQPWCGCGDVVKFRVCPFCNFVARNRLGAPSPATPTNSNEGE